MHVVVALLLSLAAAPTTSRSPEELATLVRDRFASGSLDDFRAVYPFEDGLEPVAEGVKNQRARKPGLARVIRQDGARAVLLLSGVAPSANSGDDILESRVFSGLYEAVAEAGAWRLDRRLPIDAGNRIVAQTLAVTITPGAALDVTDGLDLEVDGPHGFVVRLNHRARLAKVSWRGKAVEHAWDGGLLWVRLPGGSRGRLTLAYHLEVERGPENTNSACFLPHAGHVRNQYFWHPFFDFGSGRDRGAFDVTVRVPAAYRVATSIPQTEAVVGGQRVVRGRTTRAATALTLLYDRDWKPVTKRLGPVTLEVFATQDFDPPAADVVKEFEETYRLLSRRFGVPRQEYFAVAQGRARSARGWHFASNQTLVAGQSGGAMLSGKGQPRASFGHEVGHLWTQGAGPAANFLQEGWAVFVEGAIVRARFGEETRRRFWKGLASHYFESHDGKASLLADVHNRVSYAKGAWIFAMLEDALGGERFDRAMAEFSRRSLEVPANWEVLLECLNRHGERDLRGFLLPWLEQTAAPRPQARIDGARVIITQGQPAFELPIDVELETATGRERRRVWLGGAETTLELPAPAKRVVLDPDERLLLRREPK